MNRIIVIITLLILTSCGNIKRMASGITGSPSEYCYAGVIYLQFPSGSTIALDINGKPIACR